MTDAKVEELKKTFISMFKNDPDLGRLPLPDSIREKLSIYQSLDYISPQVAINKCLFSGERYADMVEIKPDPTIIFPDLEKLAEERKKELMITDEEKTSEKN